MEPWSTFAQVAGTAAASLIGLLFVAVSIRTDFIARSQEPTNRAAQTPSLFGTVLLTAILIAAPGQSTGALSAGLTALAVIAGGGLLATIVSALLGMAGGGQAADTAGVHRPSYEMHIADRMLAEYATG